MTDELVKLNPLEVAVPVLPEQFSAIYPGNDAWAQIDLASDIPISGTAKVVTAAGDAKLTVPTPVLGARMASFDGNGDSLTTPSHADFDFGSGDFTIDFWFRANSVAGSQDIFAKRPNASVYSPFLIWLSGAQLVFFCSTSGGGWEVNLQATVLTNTWYHVACVRAGNLFSLYRNGVLAQSASVSGTLVSNANGVTIGASGTANYYNGYLDEARISKGIARWTANFSPPSAAYSSDASTKLLLHCDGAEGSQTFVDSSGTPKTVTATGDAAQTAGLALTKIGTGMLVLDGNGDYLSIPDSPDFAFGAGDFTIDFWVRLGSVGITSRVICKPNGSDYGPFLIYQSSATLAFYASSGGGSWDAVNALSIGSLAVNTWYHVAVTRQGNTFRTFLNGTLVASATSSASLNVHTNPVLIGSNYGRSEFTNGWLDEVRISKGIARWTASFTPPATPYVSDQYTKLLLHFEGSDGSTAISDSSQLPGHPFDPGTNPAWMQIETTPGTPGTGTAKTITSGGGAALTTAQFKFGGSSVYIGSPRYAVSPDSPDWFFDTGNFTVDFWVRFNALATNSTLINNALPPNDRAWQINYNHGSGFEVALTAAGNAWNFAQTFPFTAVTNTWYHVAVVRNFSSIMVFVNGTQIGATQTYAGAVRDCADSLLIGVVSGGSNWSDAWYDEVRVSKGTARWTANFTPPAAPYVGDTSTVLLVHFDGADGSTSFVDSSPTPPVPFDPGSNPAWLEIER